MNELPKNVKIIDAQQEALTQIRRMARAILASQHNVAPEAMDSMIVEDANLAVEFNEMVARMSKVDLEPPWVDNTFTIFEVVPSPEPDFHLHVVSHRPCSKWAGDMHFAIVNQYTVNPQPEEFNG
jgi:hypothetical protein